MKHIAWIFTAMGFVVLNVFIPLLVSELHQRAEQWASSLKDHYLSQLSEPIREEHAHRLETLLSNRRGNLYKLWVVWRFGKAVSRYNRALRQVRLSQQALGGF